MIPLFFLLSTFSMGFADTHAIYLSVVELNYKKEATEITVKVFIDDLEDALHNLTKERREIGNCDALKDAITTYFSRYLKVHVNKIGFDYSWKGCEVKEDSIWLYFTGINVDSMHELRVKADYLMELFPTQTNVIQIIQGESKRFMKLTIDAPEATITFD